MRYELLLIFLAVSHLTATALYNYPLYWEYFSLSLFFSLAFLRNVFLLVLTSIVAKKKYSYIHITIHYIISVYINIHINFFLQHAAQCDCLSYPLLLSKFTKVVAFLGIKSFLQSLKTFQFFFLKLFF